MDRGRKKLRGGPKEKVTDKSGSSNFKTTISTIANSAFSVLKKNKITETIKDNPTEIITKRGMVHEFGGKQIFQAQINNNYWIMLYAETNEKIYLKESTDEYISASFGKSAYFGGKKAKFINTNKTGEKKWIIIDENTLEKISVSFADDPNDIITNRPGRGEISQMSLGGRNVLPVRTTKSPENLVLIDVDTLKRLPFHIKNHPEELITITFYKGEILGGKDTAFIQVNNKDCIVYSETLEKVTIKGCIQEELTKQIHDFGFHRNFITPFAGRKAGKFEINNDENNCAIIYFDTIEKVTLKDHPNQVITNYTCHTSNPDDHKFFLGKREVVLANINNSRSFTAIFSDTIEKVTLKDHPNQVITGIYIEGYGEHIKTKVQINNSEIIEIDPISISHKK
ncbi:MAG: hypothetical protein WAZ12_00480 [Candidatus Absconditicoccaceae bacterium]